MGVGIHYTVEPLIQDNINQACYRNKGHTLGSITTLQLEERTTDKWLVQNMSIIERIYSIPEEKEEIG